MIRNNLLEFRSRFYDLFLVRIIWGNIATEITIYITTFHPSPYANQRLQVVSYFVVPHECKYQQVYYHKGIH
jgi:ATP sulfurylase